MKSRLATEFLPQMERKLMKMDTVLWGGLASMTNGSM